jgi:hypothetical protein
MTESTTSTTGLQPVPSRIRSIGKEVGTGSTAPCFCSLHGILKFDHPQEAPNCVYNELVAMRLGVCVGAPIAMGTMVAAERGEGFVSLMIGATNFTLPDLDSALWAKASTTFPSHATALLTFDIFIGNNDRSGNLKVDMKRPGMKFFAAFDHSHCLLDANLDYENSLNQLNSNDLMLTEHPFFKAPGVTFRQAILYAERIAKLSDEIIFNCCVFGEKFRGVSLEQQESLAKALTYRRKNLPKIIRDNKKTIFST